ncbi:MAG: hypothetical protein ACFFFT_01955 [Candidatus Thorarchaeota archaeon]
MILKEKLDKLAGEIENSLLLDLVFEEIQGLIEEYQIPKGEDYIKQIEENLKMSDFDVPSKDILLDLIKKLGEESTRREMGLFELRKLECMAGHTITGEVYKEIIKDIRNLIQLHKKHVNFPRMPKKDLNPDFIIILVDPQEIERLFVYIQDCIKAFNGK